MAKQSRKWVLPLLLAAIALIVGLPLVVYLLHKAETQKPNQPPLPYIRKVVYDEIYGACIGHLLPSSEVESAKPFLDKLPPNLKWCRRKWVLRDKVAIWWAADLENLKVKPLGPSKNELELAEMQKKAGKKPTGPITFYFLVEYDAWRLQDPVAEGRKPKLEATHPKRKLIFQKNEHGKWNYVGTDHPITPDEFY